MINADSAQVYARSAHPVRTPDSPRTRRACRTACSAMSTAPTACSAAALGGGCQRRRSREAHGAGRLPILVGGTGLYIRTLLDGIAPVPEIDPAIRADGPRACRSPRPMPRWPSADPAGAARLAPADTTRVARALEVVRSTGRPLAALAGRREPAASATASHLIPLILLPRRDWLLGALRRALRARCSTDGAIEEVEALLARDSTSRLPRRCARSACARSPRWLAGEIAREAGARGARSAPRANMPSGNIPGSATSHPRTWRRRHCDRYMRTDHINLKLILRQSGVDSASFRPLAGPPLRCDASNCAADQQRTNHDREKRRRHPGRGLSDHGVEVVFGYPGGAVLPIYDALFQREPHPPHPRPPRSRRATHAAEGYARSTGKPGVVLVTSGPGATNAITGITDALMDSIPLVVITGQVATALIGTDAFQEADTVGITRHCTKHNYLVKDPAELAATIDEAFQIATIGPPRPGRGRHPQGRPGRDRALARRPAAIAHKTLSPAGRRPTRTRSTRRSRCSPRPSGRSSTPAAASSIRARAASAAAARARSGSPARRSPRR